MRRSLLLSIALTLTVASPALAKVEWFYSPSKNISREVSSGGERGAYAFCQSLQKPRSVTLSDQGTLKVCDGTKCLGDPPPRTRSSSATGSPSRSAISSACRRQQACAAAS